MGWGTEFKPDPAKQYVMLLEELRDDIRFRANRLLDESIRNAMLDEAVGVQKAINKIRSH